MQYMRPMLAGLHKTTKTEPHTDPKNVPPRYN